MSKFALLLLFIGFILFWMYQPVQYDASEEIINQYRPSYQYSPDAILKDSIKTSHAVWSKNPTAYYAPGFNPK